MHHIMFDVDGTLIESYDFDEECFVAAVSEVLGHKIDSNWDGYKHVSDAGILNEHLYRQGITENLEQIHRSVKHRFIAKLNRYVSQNPVNEIAGASALIKYLKAHEAASLSIATGGWKESATLKLQSAGIDVSGIAIASSNDHYSRAEIMKAAIQRAHVDAKHSVTYFGDAAWDKKASSELGYNFVLVGSRIEHAQSVYDLRNINQVMSLIGFC
ncbi:HAD family hydrolase [Aestuariirhabdus sp. Z084]|uniref:HAD family hydrolase n=1 Tax=Aestuariirhabdus haliotis TaxID=2918751 RepID=UPI00201B4003|nr:HAD family hydrolase [Aestuariirhabdus haliotis]MCL6416841.1 HAD family hydrolase [Aestuariirhabdus haliotis]MCL6420841.1 HAD family hydrolase [Aestuariirhabdus haliotis]